MDIMNANANNKYEYHSTMTSIKAFRLEPLVDTARNERFGYEVLSSLDTDLSADDWFDAQEPAFLISLLKKQLLRINDFSNKCDAKFFYNIPVGAMLSISPEDIYFIASYKKINLEISDAHRIKFLSVLTQHALFSQIKQFRLRGVDVWVDDFTYDDLPMIDDYYGQFDGIKLAKSELHAPWLRKELDIMRRVMGNIPLLIEGVETGDDLDTIKKCGITFAQGYYWQSYIIPIK